MRGMRLIATACLVAAGTLGMAGTAAAETTTVHGVTETFHDEVPCLGFGEITLTFNAVEHESSTPGGGIHATFTQTGTFTAVLDAGGTSSGKFTNWGNFNTADGVTGNSTFTFNLRVTSGVGAGTSFHENDHFNGALDELTDPKVAFEKSRCS
jgi:spore coat protein U-like protein